MARVKVHTDHDRGGSVITQMMFHATIDYEEWCPNTALQAKISTEESCLPYILSALRTSLPGLTLNCQAIRRLVDS